MELWATASTTLTNTTRKLPKTSEHTSTIFETHDVISTGAVSLAMKKKYAAVKSTSKSSVIQTQPSSRSTSATPQIMTATIPKGLEHSRGHSEHFNGPVVSKSLGRALRGMDEPHTMATSLCHRYARHRGRYSIMVNYLPIMLTPTTMNWFTSLALNSI